MNKTARIQASFSLPEVFLEDKIERMGNNQTKMIMPKRRRAVKSSIPRVYAVQSFGYGVVATRRGICTIHIVMHFYFVFISLVD